MSTNEQFFRSLIEDGFGKDDVTVFDRYASHDFIEHQYGINPPNIEGVKKTILSIHKAFSDFSMTVEELSADGDKVWCLMTAQGIQTGQFGPMPPTNKKVEITVIDRMRFSEGKLVEHWGVADRFALMNRLGLKPPPKIIMKLMNLFR